MEALDGLEQSLTELRQTFTSGRTRDVAWRKAQLRAILKLIDDNEAKINLALHQDLGKHPVEIYRDEVSIKNFLSPISHFAGKSVSWVIQRKVWGESYLSNVFELQFC
ncbi:Aldehyde dehydrogenase (NAD(+)) [Bertholletia excelsa]